MMRTYNRNGQHSMPLFFKIWFAFVATVAVSIMAFVVWLIISVADAGPEGIGSALGTAFRAFNEAQ